MLEYKASTIIANSFLEIWFAFFKAFNFLKVVNHRHSIFYILFCNNSIIYKI